MAGFFGLFNYEKEGPGISKNAPKKKTFIVFFETFFRNFWKFITINLVYDLISVPVLTNGLASAGLTNVTRNIARDKHSFGLSDFFDTLIFLLVFFKGNNGVDRGWHMRMYSFYIHGYELLYMDAYDNL